MSTTLNFIKKHWITLGLLVGSLFAVNWFVTHNRAPGSMTVIEAQSMDMTGIKPPLGVLPVSLDTVHTMGLVGGSSFPAVVSAFNDEDVVARIPGKLSRILVYPGDRVVAGQVLATIDAPEYDAQMRKAQAMSSAKASEVLSAEQMIDHHRNILTGSRASIRVAEASLSRSKTDVEAAQLELQKAQDELAGTKAAKEERQADLTYAEKELVREQQLYTKGAISLDELQTSQRDRDATLARVRNAEATIQSATQSIHIAERRLKASQQTVTESEAQLDVANSTAAQAQEAIDQAHADANAVRFESDAASADVASAAAFVDYRKLTALSSGVVSERVVSPGTAVMAGQVVLRLKSVGHVRVQADVPQSLSGTVRAGAPVRIVTDSVVRQAKLTSVFPIVDPQTRTFRVEAIVADSTGALKPGMFARIELEGTGVRQLVVRSVAVQSDDTGKYVWITAARPGTGKVDWTCTMHPQVSETGPGKCPICGMDLVLREKGGNMMAHRQPVTIGEHAEDYTAVLSGLHEGDKVVWKGFEDLIEGTAISDVGGPPPEPAGAKTSMPGMDMPEDTPSQKAPPPRKVSRVTKPPAHASPKLVADYTCPMHKSVHSDHPGSCPICGMDLVKRDGAK